jgi:hypothetical protein
MRMWMINPKLLCNKHLLGEYAEIFKHRHNFVKQYSIKGRIGQIEPLKMANRVEELRKEGIERGFNMKAIYIIPDLSYLSDEELNSKVDTNKSIQDLLNRCPECKKRIENN